MQAERSIKGQTTRETRYFLLSEPLAPDQLLTKVWKHWRIENSLHWVLDVTLTGKKTDEVMDGLRTHCIEF